MKERRRRKEKKGKRTKRPRRKGEKKSKVAAGYYLWVPFVCLITILPLSYKLWKLKTHFSYEL